MCQPRRASASCLWGLCLVRFSFVERHTQHAAHDSYDAHLLNSLSLPPSSIALVMTMVHYDSRTCSCARERSRRCSPCTAKKAHHAMLLPACTSTPCSVLSCPVCRLVDVCCCLRLLERVISRNVPHVPPEKQDIRKLIFGSFRSAGPIRAFPVPLALCWTTCWQACGRHSCWPLSVFSA